MWHYYPFVNELDKYLVGGKTLNNSSNKVCVPNKIEDLNIYIF